MSDGKERPLKDISDKRLVVLYFSSVKPCIDNPAYESLTLQEWIPIIKDEFHHRSLKTPENQYWKEFSESNGNKMWRSLSGIEKPIKELTDKRLTLFYLGNKRPCLSHPAYRDYSPNKWVLILEAEFHRRNLDIPDDDSPSLDKESLV